MYTYITYGILSGDLASRLRVQALPGKIFPQFIFQLVMSEACWWCKAALDDSILEFKD